MSIKNYAVAAVTIFIALPMVAVAQQRPEPKGILENADRARSGVRNGMTWEVEISTSEKGAKKPAVSDAKTEKKSDANATLGTKSTYHVKTYEDSALVEALSPSRSKGEVMLFQTRAIWFFKPGLKRPVSYSARQKLSGQASNGDIASTYYSRDYEGKIVEEAIEQGKDCWVMELKSKSDDTTYDRIKYWVSKKDQLGMKAIFMTPEGEPLKVATFEYGNKISHGGKSLDFIKTVKIEDARNKEDYSILNYSNPKPEVQSPSIFNVNNMIR
jgi:hypothetical protein